MLDQARYVDTDLNPCASSPILYQRGLPIRAPAHTPTRPSIHPIYPPPPTSLLLPTTDNGGNEMRFYVFFGPIWSTFFLSAFFYISTIRVLNKCVDYSSVVVSSSQ